MANRGWDHWALWEELLWLVSSDDRDVLEDDVRAMRARLDAPICIPTEESSGAVGSISVGRVRCASRNASSSWKASSDA